MESRTVILIFNGNDDFDPIMRCTVNLLVMVSANDMKGFGRLQYLLSKNCEFVNPYNDDHELQTKTDLLIKKISLDIPTVLVPGDSSGWLKCVT